MSAVPTTPSLDTMNNAQPNTKPQAQATLIQTYGEGPSGGITPTTKIPALCRAFGLEYRVFVGQELQHYLQEHLPHSHVFCAYKRESFAHAVLIYRLISWLLVAVVGWVAFFAVFRTSTDADGWDAVASEPPPAGSLLRRPVRSPAEPHRAGLHRAARPGPGRPAGVRAPAAG